MAAATLGTADGQRQSTHITALDGFRGVAILLVLVSHILPGISIGIPALAWVVSRATEEGGAGVDLFFVLSGFLITGILLDTKGKQHFLLNFYARRALRIFPIYYAVLFLFLVVAPQVEILYGQRPATLEHSTWWLWTYTFNILISHLNTWQVGRVLTLMTPYWSLCVEEQFYLVWPLVVFVASRRQLLWILLVVIATAFFLRWYNAAHLPPPQLATYVMLPYRMDSLAAGGFVAWLWRSDLRDSRVLNRIARCSLVAAAICTIIGICVGWNLPGAPSLVLWRLPLLAILAATTIMTSVTSPPGSRLNQVLSASWLRFFGRYSYGIYVYHFIIIGLVPPALQKVAAKLISNPTGETLALKALALAATVAIAVISWHSFEQPILRLKRHFRFSAAADPADNVQRTAVATSVGL